MDKLELTTFDITQYLDSKEAIAEYLSQVLQDGDNQELIRAIGYIAKAKGMSKVAKETKLSRESLYKALKSDAKPRFETILKVIDSLDLQLLVAPKR